MVITRNAGNIGICSCKVGACRKCGSTCKRCKCACDGILPIDALAQNRGRPFKRKRKVDKNVKQVEKRALRPRRKKMNCVTSKGKKNNLISAEDSIDEDDISFFTPTNVSVDTRSFVTGICSTTTGKSLHSLRQVNNVRQSTSNTTNELKEHALKNTQINISRDMEELDINSLENTVLSPSTSLLNLTDVPKLPEFPKNIATTETLKANHIFHEDTLSKNNEKLATLIDYFKLPEHYKKNLPAFKARAFSNQLLQNHHSRSKRMVTMMVHCIEKIAGLVCPGPSKNAILKLVRKQIKQKVEKLGSDNETDYKAKYNKLSTSLLLAQKNLKNRSIERRVLRAILYDGSIKKDRMHLIEKHNVKFGTGQPEILARADYNLLLEGNNLEKKKYSYSSKSDRTIKSAVEFVLSDKFSIPTSYGTHEVYLGDNETISFPNIMRAQTRTIIIDSYLRHTKNQPHLGRKTMYEILRHITSTDEVILTAIDYVTSLLVNEPCEVLQSIINKCLHPSKQVYATSIVLCARNFLKHQYADHVSRSNEVVPICYHGIDYGLLKDGLPRTSHDCCACKFPFYSTSKLKELVRQSPSSDKEMIDDAIHVIDNTTEKFALYMGHVCRKRSQSSQIKDREKYIQKCCEHSKGKDTKCIAVMDFKMKFESMSARESSVEHFGKRGMGWHGFALMYYLWEKNIKTNQYCTQKYIIYIDQVLKDGAKQDSMTVISLIESALQVIYNEFPFINEVILQSDNASTYQNHNVLIGIHLLNIKFFKKVFVSEYLHSETQDGKTILDAHYGTCVRHLKKFMKMWRPNVVTRIQTPKGLAFALTYSGGLLNSVVQLVEIDHMKLETLRQKFEPITQKLKEYFNRVNHVYFQQISESSTNDPDDVILNGSFSFEASAFSGVGRKVKFFINFNDKEVTPDDIALTEIQSVLAGNEKRISKQVTFGTEETHNKDDDLIIDNDSSSLDFTYHPLTSRKSKVDGLSKIKNTKRHKGSVDSESDDSDSSFEILSASDDEDDDDINNMHGIVYNDCIDINYAEPHEEYYGKHLFYTNLKIVKQLLVGTPKPHQNLMDDSIGKVIKKKSRRLIPNGKVVRNDAIAKAIRYASTVISTSNYFKDHKAENQLYLETESFSPSSNQIFKPGWARRPAHGESYGDSYIKYYKDDLYKYYTAGELDSNKKMSAGKMREMLMRDYPSRFSIPGETEIKSWIGAQQTKKKYKKKGTRDGGGRGRPSSDYQKSDWEKVIETVVESEPSAKPEDLYKSFLNMHNDETTLPTDVPRDDTNNIDKKKIKQKINQHKSKLKKSAKMAIL